MREIKFRAWDKQTNTMSVNGHIFLDTPPTAFTAKLILMQFTGLHDKNGKEVYEGDIIIATFAFGDTDMLHKERARVYYAEQNAAFVMQSLDGKKYALFDRNYSDGYEVIGNVYENPELLS